MEPAKLLAMRVIRSLLILLLAAGTVYVLALLVSPEASSSEAVVVEAGPVVSRPMAEPMLPAESRIEQEDPIVVDAPPEAEQKAQRVDSIEERGDAMLFEIDALQATPFDSAITQPFD